MKPHKGGRTVQKTALFTPANARKLRKHLRENDISFGDWLQAMIGIDCRSWAYTYKLPSGEWQEIALANSLGEAIENAEFHAQGREIRITKTNHEKKSD